MKQYQLHFLDQLTSSKISQQFHSISEQLFLCSNNKSINELPFFLSDE